MTLTENRLATVLISVDIARNQEDSSVLTGLLEALRRHRTAALWSLEFERAAASVDRIRGAWPAHEFGLLARDTWAGPQASRNIFGRELSARMACALTMGIVPEALALADTDPPSHYDLLVKHRIPLIRTRTDSLATGSDGLQPKLSRYGIWQANPTLVLPVSSRWSLPWTARRKLNQVIASGLTMHIAVDVAALAVSPSAGLASLEYLLKLVSRRRDAGELQIVAASQLLTSYLPRRQQFVSRSVLRAA